MSEPHVSREALEQYVLGALDEIEVARVEAHVLACRACEARLQHEASLELAFTRVVCSEARTHELAARLEARPRRAVRIVGPAAAVSSVFAVAAAMLLWLTPRTELDPRSPGAEPPAISEASGDASAVTARLEVVVDGSPRSALRD